MSPSHHQGHTLYRRRSPDAGDAIAMFCLVSGVVVFVCLVCIWAVTSVRSRTAEKDRRAKAPRRASRDDGGNGCRAFSSGLDGLRCYSDHV
ncbi:hypothetical protein Trco_003994 [Trichoderma cornu-damae]|uniref:Uncharacterized protein n=1 Tax=Trichoderma cornu-damae TaxID=654480 RepID=A0A9P8QM37_9HYPO|nr:hypothetical protein Trco_003994 [Trichoderma cornu-damae]